jgi:hypothetical protein
MRNSTLPSGPANPRAVRADAAAQQEELDELAGDASGDNTALSQDPNADARHAERNAHPGEQNANASGVGRSR